jgi:hypothetical protein
MNYSAELRWFFQNDSFETVSEWFKNYSEISPKSEKTRADFYLLFPGCDTVGVKLREEKFEIKALVSPPRPVKFDFGVSGKLDQWAKWSTEFSQIADFIDFEDKNGKWIKVEKTRLLRKFSADDGKPEEVDAEAAQPDAGCNVEATFIEIEAKPRKWVSVAFEAFGSIADTPKVLDETVQKFLSGYESIPGENLSLYSSFSYPAWLSGF